MSVILITIRHHTLCKHHKLTYMYIIYDYLLHVYLTILLFLSILLYILIIPFPYIFAPYRDTDTAMPS